MKEFSQYKLDENLEKVTGGIEDNRSTGIQDRFHANDIALLKGVTKVTIVSKKPFGSNTFGTKKNQFTMYNVRTEDGAIIVAAEKDLSPL